MAGAGTLTTQRAGGLIVLALSLAYGLGVTGIASPPGAAAAGFTPRTFPYILAVLGVGCGLLLVLVPPRQESAAETVAGAFAGLDWAPAARLVVLMVAYGWLMPRLGFVPATVLFLGGGLFALGIRSPAVLVLGSVPLAVGFWLVLAGLMGLYLAPGSWWP